MWNIGIFLLLIGGYLFISLVLSAFVSGFLGEFKGELCFILLCLIGLFFLFCWYEYVGLSELDFKELICDLRRFK